MQTQADLSIAKSIPATAFLGGDLTYTLTITNSGPSDAQFIVLSDPFPDHTSMVTASEPDGWSCTTQAKPLAHINGGLTCHLALLEGGETQSITVTVHISTEATEGELLSNQTSIGSSTTDPNLASNLATASTTVIKAPSSTTIVSSSNPVQFLYTVTFTATVTSSVGAPQGTMTFKADGEVIEGCSTLPLSAGAAACSVMDLYLGPHAITAEYSGFYDLPSSGTLTQTVNGYAWFFRSFSVQTSWSRQSLFLGA